MAAEPRSKARARDSAKPAAKLAEALPLPVAEMRDMILVAVMSGNIEEMRTALDWNELKPQVAETHVGDVIAYWRAQSPDGSGADILAALAGILSQPHAVLPVGRDLENNRLYVWPRFAEVSEAELSPAEREARNRLIPAPVLEEMARTGRYLWWRLVIGADSTWHALLKGR